MDHRGRRGRRRSEFHQLPSIPETSSFFGGAKDLALTVGVVCLTFMMMQYNCKYCHSRQELSKLTSSLDEIAKHLDTVTNNYMLLEGKLSTYSHQMPKLEEEMAALELLAHAAHAAEATGGWNHRRHNSLPYVDVHLNKGIENIQAIPVSSTTKIKRPIRRGRLRAKKYIERN